MCKIENKELEERNSVCKDTVRIYSRTRLYPSARNGQFFPHYKHKLYPSILQHVIKLAGKKINSL